jgi:hypothetical protein
LSASRNDVIGITNYLIVVDAVYFGEVRNYDTAVDSSGNRLNFAHSFKKTDYCDNSGCWQEENFQISTSREFLRANQGKDLPIKVSGKAGKYQTFVLPANYIKAFLAIVKDL